MRKIDLSVVTATKGYPALANNPNVQVGLDFLQQLFQDIVTRFGVAFDNQRFGPPILLNGLAWNGTQPNAGAMYYTAGGNAGEIFIYNGGPVNGSASGNNWIACSYVLNPTDTNPNQTILSDGSPVSIHNQRTLQFTYANAPNTGNLPDYAIFTGGQWVVQWVPTQIAVNAANIALLLPGAWNGIAYQNGWADYGNGYNAGRYRIENDLVRFSGAIVGGANNTVIGVLPAGFRPAKTVLVQIPGESTGVNVCSITISSAGVMTINYPGTPTFFSLESVIIPLT